MATSVPIAGLPVLVPASVQGDDLLPIVDVHDLTDPTGTTKQVALSSLVQYTNHYSSVFNVMAYGATGNGTTDDTVAIQSAITAAGSVNGDVYLPTGTYITTGGIALPSNIRFRGAGPGTILKLQPSIAIGTIAVMVNNTAIYPTGGNTNIVIQDMTFDGSYVGGTAAPSSTQQLYLSQCTNCRVINVRFINGRRNSLCLEFSKDMLVDRCTFDTCAVNSLYISGCDYVTINDCITRKNGGGGSGGGIALSNSWFCTCTGNMLVEPTLGGSGLQIGHDSEYCTITGGYIENAISDSITLTGTQYFASERIGQPSYDGTTLYTFSNCTFAGVTFSSALGQNITSAFTVLYGGNNNYVACTFANCWGAGLYLSGSIGNVVKQCLFSRCGVTAKGSSASTIFTALVIEGLAGIYTGNGNLVEGCTITDTQSSPTTTGILLGGNATPMYTILKNNLVLVSTPLTITNLATVKVTQIGNVFNSTPTAPSAIYGTAAPTTGTYAVGDIVWNTAPISGGTIGFVCTTAGTPGTWKTFGVIS